MLIFAALLHAFFVLGFTVRILLRDDLTPSARLAWFVVLIFIPFGGGVVYFLFGEADIGQTARERHAAIFATIRSRAGMFMGDAQSVDTLIDPDFRPAFRYGGSINGFYPVSGNTAALMADADDFTDQLIADIDAATEHVHVLFYIWLDDTTGTAVAEALIRAVGRGVTCRAIADGLGSRALIKAPLWQQMRQAGVTLAVAFPLSHPIKTLIYSRVDLRNHRKITVIDGRITYCGSRNSADPAFRPKPRFAPWVDIMLRFEGPVVSQNQLLFASDWKQATGEDLEGLSLHLGTQPDGFPALVVGDGPTERRAATPQLFATLIAAARETVFVTTPYFVPDATVMDALCAAAHRGVRVRLTFPKRNDSWIVAAASRSYYRRLLAAGCEITEYRDGLLHAKILTIDGAVSLIGSSNLDMRSFDLNYENNILLQDRDLTAAIEARQDRYVAQADLVTLQQVVAWPFYRRIWNNAVATAGPIL